MNSPVFGLRLVSAFAALGCLAHLARLFLKFKILIGSHAVPLAASGVALVALALVSIWFWKLSLAAKPAEAPKSAAA